MDSPELCGNSPDGFEDTRTNLVEDISQKPSPMETLEKGSSVHRYEEEWDQLCRCDSDDDSLEELRQQAISGGLRASRFRSVCWRLLLGALSAGAPRCWLEETRGARRHYSALKKKFWINPWQGVGKPRCDNPLSQDDQSSWRQYFCNKELRAVIHQDVIRTFPGVDFFRDELIQEAMVNVLFCYARQYPTMCYRQGMHEILAPLVFVLHCDHQALLHTKEQSAEISDMIYEVLDPACLEEDSYTLFHRIMSSIEGSYFITDLAPTSTGYFPSRPNVMSPVPENQVIAQLNSIRDNLLAPNDPQLYQHLQQLDISLPLFGIRWLRLLFGREFPLQDLLVLWDAIFAEGRSFELVNYIVVTMLIAIRYQLLSSDYTECLTYLMRYPGSMDISYIIDNALYLKDPTKNCQPAMPAFPIMTTMKETTSQVANCATEPKKPQRPQRLDTKQTTSIAGRLKKLSTRPKRWTGPAPSAVPAEDSTIVDGVLLDDPVVLRTELTHARAVMSLCRLKLAQYHLVLEKAVALSDTSGQQALTGIHELCSLLDERNICYSQRSPSLEVEAASEAGENNRYFGSTPLLTPSPCPATQLPPGANVPMILLGPRPRPPSNDIAGPAPKGEECILGAASR